jgi:hypothetical protein
MRDLPILTRGRRTALSRHQVSGEFELLLADRPVRVRLARDRARIRAPTITLSPPDI